MARRGQLINLRKAEARRQRKLSTIICAGCGEVFQSTDVTAERCPDCQREVEHLAGAHDLGDRFDSDCAYCRLDWECSA